ncbi:FGGY-family carbohydrate kinase [Muricomes intestini]|mgnify:CR=1 FL=1|uniref:FGGY-family carbohydrate kinase n=1 Tax=Muricomes intestini TaxID=1796634 RepID=UPI002FE2941B
MSYIGLDIGTSGCKAAVISTEGKILFSSAQEYSFLSPHPGWVELNPAQVWQSVCRILTEISPYARDTRSIAVSSIGESIVMLNSEDKILYNGIIYLDQRCKDTLPEIEEKIPAYELHKITGVSVNQMFTLNKFIWFKKHMPGLLEQADKFFLFGDYITYMLSGVRAIDPGSASRTMFFDVRTLRWSQQIAELFEIPIDRFSKITLPGTVLGSIRETLANKLGLPKTLSVIMGIHDQCAATLGSGSLIPGEATLGQGSTESINCVVHREHLNTLVIENQLCFEPYIDKEHYIIITGNLTHGSSINWFIRNFYEDSNRSSFSYDELYRECPQTAGDVFFLPYLSKVSLMNPKNHALGGFLGIDITVTRPQMFRALLEGLCYETRMNIEIFQKLGESIKKLTASGGVSKAALYMQMKADVIGYPIHILENPQAGITGLAIISAVSTRDYSTYEEAVQTFVTTSRTYVPKRSYEEQYRKYQLISSSVKSLYDKLDEKES